MSDRTIYSELSFAEEYNMTGEEAHRIFVKFGPVKMNLDILMREKAERVRRTGKIRNSGKK